MTLGERIRAQRQRTGLSQEKVAELVGVSRQAVTKWESGQSAPSTENLLKLAEIFGTGADLLLTKEKEEPPVEERAYALFQAMQERQAEERRRQRRKNICAALLVAVGYLLLYLVGLLLWSDAGTASVLGWLRMAVPKGEQSYLFGWLLHKRLIWFAMALSVLTALWGKDRLAVTTLAGFLAGFFVGVLFGPAPEGAAYGHGHYGWAIWGVVYLCAILVGILLQHLTGKEKT